jgi:hypothetical protein
MPNPILPDSMGKSGRARVEADFSVESEAEGISAVYAHVHSYDMG